MKIKAKKENLLEALKKVAPICGCKFQPILSNVLIETTEAGALITGSNTSISIKSSVICEVIESGSVALQASKFTQIVETLSDDIELLNGEDKDFFIISGKTKIKLESFESQYFPPKLFDLEVISQLDLESGVLLKGLEKTLVTAKIGTMDLLNGINIFANDNKITLCSTDGNVAGEFIDSIKQTNDFNLILPSDTAKEILRIFKGGNDLTLSVGKSALIISDGDVFMKSALMEGLFPNMSGILSDPRENYFVIGKEYLNSIIRRCQILKSNVKGELSILKFNVEGIKVDLSFKDVLTETTIVEKSGEDLFIGFDFILLERILKNIETSSLKFEVKNNTSAVYLQDGNCKILIVPCQIGAKK